MLLDVSAYREYYFSGYSLVLMLLSLAVTFWAQWNVKSTYAHSASLKTAAGLTGAQVARRLLDREGLYSVQIARVKGQMTDHYDPLTETVYLSEGVYDSASVAAVGIAAHETGHAIQHSTEYAPLKLRMAMVPVCNIGSALAVPLVLMGILLAFPALSNLGLLLFSAMVFFQLVTLPVEFNASRRALAAVEECRIVDGEEQKQTQKMLTAAALTYVAALAVSLFNLLRLLMAARRR